MEIQFLVHLGRQDAVVHSVQLLDTMVPMDCQTVMVLHLTIEVLSETLSGP